MSNIVLCVTHAKDYYTIDLVMSELDALGREPIRIDSDLFPATLQLSHAPGDDLPQIRLPNGRFIPGADVGGVWLRKIHPPSFDELLEREFRRMCRNETAAALRGILGAFDGLPSIDPLHLQLRAEDKQYQLWEAKRVGLRIPRGLISNDPVAVRALFEELDGRMIAKMLTPVTTSMSRPDTFVYTNQVSEEDLDDLETLRYSPTVFQESIEKQQELRVAYVDGQLFAGALDAGETELGQTDWRRSEAGALQWQPAHVPDDVAQAITRLMNRLGLLFGAIDLIETPSGEFVFLEVNPSGEWGMLQRDLNLPIAQAIAKALHRRMK